jgi:hypothetical protein
VHVIGTREPADEPDGSRSRSGWGPGARVLSFGASGESRIPADFCLLGHWCPRVPTSRRSETRRDGTSLSDAALSGSPRRHSPAVSSTDLDGMSDRCCSPTSPFGCSAATTSRSPPSAKRQPISRRQGARERCRSRSAIPCSSIRSPMNNCVDGCPRAPRRARIRHTSLTAPERPDSCRQLAQGRFVRLLLHSSTWGTPWCEEGACQGALRQRRWSRPCWD